MTVVEYILLKCFSDACGVYQVLQRNKTNKFVCKICNEKQSVKKVYGTSYKAKDLRELCQKYNMEKGQQSTQKAKLKRELAEISDPSTDVDNLFEEVGKPQEPPQKKQSKWVKYEEPKKEIEEEDEDETGFVLLPPEKAKNQRAKKGAAKKQASTPKQPTTSRDNDTFSSSRFDDEFNDDDFSALLDDISYKPPTTTKFSTPATNNTSNRPTTNTFNNKTTTPTLPINKPAPTYSKPSTPNLPSNNISKPIMPHTSAFPPQPKPTIAKPASAKASKWSQYVEETKAESDDEDDNLTWNDNSKYVAVEEERE